jgi:predicted amidophosphoribosyltransferase
LTSAPKASAVSRDTFAAKIWKFPIFLTRRTICRATMRQTARTQRPLYQNYEIDESLIEPIPSRIAVVDDVLTTGAHFRTMKRILQETFPEAQVIGLFLARRIPNTE